MKVGIIIHSQSGNTASLAGKIAEAIRNKGHEAEIHLLRPVGVVKPSSKNIEFRRDPDLSGYDTILLGCPVWAFTASNVMIAYLNKLKMLKNKKVLPFVTHSLFKFLGANKAIDRMTSLLEMMMADVLEGETMFRFFAENKKRTDETVSRILNKIGI